MLASFMPNRHSSPNLLGLILDRFTLIGLGGLSLVFVIQFSARFLWWTELLTHFYLQYFLLSIVVAVICVVRRRAYRLSIAVVLIMLLAAQLLPYYYQNRAAALNSNHHQVTVLFSNFNYGNTDYAALQKVVNATNPDLVAVAELPIDHFTGLKTYLPNYTYTYQQQDRDHQGIAVYSREKFATAPQTYWPTGNQFPIIGFTLQPFSDQPPLQFLIIHPPPPLTAEAAQARDDTFAWLAQFAGTVHTPLVIAGDFNSTSWSPDFIKLLSQTELRDSRANNGLQPSWPTQLPKFLRIPIDQVLISPEISVIDRQIMPSVGSDHLPVLIKLGY